MLLSQKTLPFSNWLWLLKFWSKLFKRLCSQTTSSKLLQTCILASTSLTTLGQNGYPSHFWLAWVRTCVFTSNACWRRSPSFAPIGSCIYHARILLLLHGHTNAVDMCRGFDQYGNDIKGVSKSENKTLCRLNIFDQILGNLPTSHHVKLPYMVSLGI